MFLRLVLGLSCGALIACCQADSTDAATEFHKAIQPILEDNCYDCHADGMNKGKVSFDEFKSDAELVGKRDLWLAVLKNVRSGLMPPPKKSKPSDEARQQLEHWIKYQAFDIDPADPDPGRVTLRRLNRVEYRNTVRDLMGIDYRTDEEFPPDDTGYGFDNIGDVLTLSPLLLEKYMQAAEAIVSKAVPTVFKVMPEKSIPGGQFRSKEGELKGDRISFYQEARVQAEFEAKHPGTYRIAVELNVNGAFDFDPGKCRLTLKIDDRQLLDQEFIWKDNQKYNFEYEQKLESGKHPLVFELQPLTPADQKKTSVDMRVVSVRIQGPEEKEHWSMTRNYDRFFFDHEPPDGAAERRAYARQVLERFATRAFRRPVDAGTVDRLTAIAEESYQQSGRRFEEGVARAMVGVLASPRFLFRVEGTLPAENNGKHPLIDEYALASRLSYFLWSTQPDEELISLADRGELRKNLPAQVKRMLADRKSDEMLENFVGQWLQARDVEGISINERVVLARDRGEEADMRKIRQRLQELQAKTELTSEEQEERKQLIEARRKRANRQNVELDHALRQALRRESEMFFGHVVREDRSVLELIDSDYTFLNERLAKHYGIPDVTGNDMRLVKLAPDSPRGGILTQGTLLIVTSNPTRTSPVKRGLFILDNVLGTPPPPPPADVPDLEESEKEFKDREPTLKEVLEMHRSKPLCSSCHSRMDPLGLALESFNALGMWRDSERGQPIMAGGQLITGEAFEDARGLKKILTTDRRKDFYQCLTEKLLTYALGRGLEYYDVETVDRIVLNLERDGGRFSTLLTGIIESAPFQKRRNPGAGLSDVPAGTAGTQARLLP